MKKYKCLVCGAEFEWDGEGEPVCPVCKATGENLVPLEKTETEETAEISSAPESPEPGQEGNLFFTDPYARHDDSIPHMEDIHTMALTGQPVSGAMATTLPLPKWDDILLLGGQLAHMPLENNEPVSLTTVIGHNAVKPMVLDSPVYITHMSFGALSKEAKVALSKGSAMAGTAMCSRAAFCRRRWRLLINTFLSMCLINTVLLMRISGILMLLR